MAYTYPESEAAESGLLDVGDGHQIYWESGGNPSGRPAVYLHGGPGSGARPSARRFFDPAAYRGILLDQRGSGRSRPLADEPDAELSTNTTAHLVADLERLRGHLGIERWTVLGISWGTTLGLAYAETYPERVSGLVLGLVTATDRREVEWMTRGLRRIYPREWDRFAAAVPERLRDVPLVDAYATMLADPDADVRAHAALEWCRWDNAQMGRAELPARFEDPALRLRMSRLVTHYWRHGAFLEEGQLLRDAVKLNGIPGALIQGRSDVSCPLDTAYDLATRWTTARLEVVDAGHGGGDFTTAVTGALNRLAAERP